MASRNLNSDKSIKRHRVCTLEAITEERELDSEPKEVKQARNIGTNFKPFRSSWNDSSHNNRGSYQAPRIEARGNSRQQFESLKKDYEQLLEKSKWHELEKQSNASKISKLETEVKRLKSLLGQNILRVNLEVKNAEQLKTDYEFMLETHKKKFKIREKELLEQMEPLNIESYKEKPAENNSQTMNVDSFEYEEMTEKLKSFEKQNDSLQKDKEAIELQYAQLKNDWNKVKRVLTSILEENRKIRNANRQPKWLNIQLCTNKTSISSEVSTIQGKNTDNSKRPVDSEACVKTISDLEKHKKNCIQFSRLIMKKFNVYRLIQDNEVKKILSELQQASNILNHSNPSELYIETEQDIEKILSETISCICRSVCDGEILNSQKGMARYDSCDFLLNLLKICSIKFETASQYQNPLESIPEIDEMNGERFNIMNLSDSEKINKCNIFSEENTCDNVMNNDRVQFIIKENQNLTEKIDQLQSENDAQKLKIEKISNKNKENEDDIIKIKSEKMEIERKKNGMKNNIDGLQSLIDNYKLQLEELTEMLNNDSVKSRIQKYNRLIMENKASASTKKFYKYEKAEFQTQIENNREMLHQRMVELKSLIHPLREENKNLKATISKMNTEMQEIGTEYKKWKNLLVNHVSAEFGTIDADICKAKKMYESIIILLKKEIKEKNSIIHTVQKETNEAIKMYKQHSTNQRIPEINAFDYSKSITYQKSVTTNYDSKIIFDENSKFEDLTNGGKVPNRSEKKSAALTTADSRKGDRWKKSRTREHDSRRNIDSTILS